MGHRLIQIIHECSICEKIPEDGEHMWEMGTEIWCQECCDNPIEEETEPQFEGWVDY